ncbi:MAG: nucleotide exchange factor GrpE [Ardenticatenaceae bacterium]|nr:nucleotide exchange factor GrpE [Ardenticatenaceae bacterium]
MSSDRRQVWATLAELLQRVESGSETADLQDLKEEVRKVGKTQFKVNMLVESQAVQWQAAVAALQAAQTESNQATADQRLLTAILPALDGVEEALASGQRLVAQLVEEAVERQMLVGWLDGLRLVRDRLLSLLESGGVMMIEAVGRPFDPYVHRAVGVTTELPAGWENGRQGLVVKEERRGYQTAVGVLRYADVIVYKSEK